MDIVCECGLEHCDVFLKVTKAEYEEVRTDPRKFIIARDHLIHDVDGLVMDAGRFAVVAKREGEAERIAVLTDPRT